MKKMQGICFKCLSPNHQVANCSEQWLCWRCKKSGHIARNCDDLDSGDTDTRQRAPPSSTPAERSYAGAVMAGSSSSSSRRDHRNRPEEGHCAITATVEMMNAAGTFDAHAVVVWLGDNRPHTTADEAAATFRHEFRIPAGELQVSPHALEDFLVFFNDTRKRDKAVNSVFSRGGRTYKVLPWRATRHTDEVTHRFRARLCVENMPVHAWVRAAAEVVAGASNTVESIEASSLRRDSTATFDMWITTDDPFAIPKASWFTIRPPADDAPAVYSVSLQQPASRWSSSSDPQTGFTSKLLLHLDRYVDLSPRSTREEIKLDWCLGRVDGASPSNYVRGCREQGERVSTNRRDHDDRDDDSRRDRSSSRSERSGFRGLFSRSSSKNRYEPYQSRTPYDSRRYNDYNAARGNGKDIVSDSPSKGPLRRRQPCQPRLPSSASATVTKKESEEAAEVLLADDDCTLSNFLTTIAAKKPAAVLPTPAKEAPIPEDAEEDTQLARRSARLSKNPTGAGGLELRAMEFLAKGLEIIHDDDKLDDAAKALFAKMFQGPKPISSAAILAIEKLVTMIKKKVNKKKSKNEKGKVAAATPVVTEILSNG